jgi:TonB family protein
MKENVERWQSRIVDGRFPLQSYLGGSDHSAVYLTVLRGGADDSDSKEAAIKLISADAADAEEQLRRWKAARSLNHPNLIRVFEAGRCELEGTALLYVVEEYAEENLSQILPQRALTAEETRGTFPPVLRALQYLHDQGLVHGHIKPSNILAIGDQVKLSSDAVSRDGSEGEKRTSAYDPPEGATGVTSKASDIWRLGMTLVEVLTQHLPAWDRAWPSAPDLPVSVGEPFREIAQHCLQVEPGDRWTVAQILSRMETDRPAPKRMQAEKIPASPAIPTSPKTSAKWPYFVLLAAVLAIVIFLIARPKPSNSPSEVPSTQAQQGPTAGNTQPGTSQPERVPAQPKPKPRPGAANPGETTTAEEKEAANAGGSEVVRRVMPEVSPGARRTIHGTIKVRVKVEVDAAGNVTEAKFESAGPSKYFSRLALEAAREWKFAPAQDGESGVREWKLQFAFSRARTEASLVRPKR